jgi:cell cycle sensor histidine kinase DivJ
LLLPSGKLGNVLRTTIKTGFLTELASRWVHGSILNNSELAHSHAKFIAGHLAGGLIALLVLPLWLAAKQGVTAFEAGVFLWLIVPIALASYVSATGRLNWGRNGSLFASSGFIAWFCVLSGGLSSGILFWLCILPIEAALFGGRKTILVGLGAALAGFAAVLLAQMFIQVQVPEAYASQSYAYSVMAALTYGAMLAFRIDNRRQDSTAKVVAEEGKFQLLANNTSDLITLHSENGEARYASSASSKLLGCTSASLVGSGFFERVHLHDRIAYKTAFSDAANTGAEVTVAYRIQSDLNDEEGKPSTRWMETRCRKILDPITGAVEIVAVTRDISTIKETEAALTHQREEAEKSSEAKSRFLANMSHELRTPLNAIIGFSDILKQELFGKLEYEKHHEYVGLIKDSGEHLLHLVNGILDISKIEAGRYELLPEPFDVRELISSTCAMVLPQATSQNIVVSQLIGNNLPELNADRRAYRQVLLNLLSNAIKFSPKGGKIDIEITNVAGNIKMTVRDFGVGIPAKDLKAIGEPFFQVENANTRGYEGTGLGLFLVKGLVELHNGSFKIESEQDAGTTVTVIIPVEQVRSRPVPADENGSLVHLHTKSKKVSINHRSNENARIQARN